MSSTEFRSKSTTDGFACANCGEPNPADSKFCSGCGETLFQKCPSCDQAARFGVLFCGNCGCNLQEEYKKNRTQLLDTVRRARDLGRDHEYGEAIYLANLGTQVPDFRFRDISLKASELLEKLRGRQQKYEALVERTVPAAREAYQRGQLDETVQLLSAIPTKLLDEKALGMLEMARRSTSEESSLSVELEDALDRKDFAKAGVLLTQLTQIQPDNEKYKNLAIQVGRTLLKQGVQHYDNGEYSAAAEKLDHIPPAARDEQYHKVRTILDELFWLRGHVRRYPFASPSLAKLCQKLVKLTPRDPVASQMHEKILEQMKTPPVESRGIFARWVPMESAYWKCHPDYLARLHSLDGSTCVATSKHPMRFAAAIGAAIQGIDQGRLSFRFGGRHERKGIRDLLKRKKDEAVVAWGIDIGASAIRAVRLERSSDDDVVRLTDAEFLSFETPLCRPTHQNTGGSIVRDALRQLCEKHPLQEEPVWGTVAGRQVLGRFVEMPPTDRKKLAKLVDMEFSQQFPVPKDQMVTQHWISDRESEEATPHYAALMGVRNFVIEQQVHLYGEVGIELAGLQIEPVALANLIYREFAEELTPSEEQVDPPAVALLDVGTESTVFVICTPDRYWFKSFDLGGDSFSSAIAKHLKVPISKADIVKESLTSQPVVAPLYEVLSSRFGAYNIRLRQMFTTCRREIGDFKLKGLWCTGGGCLTHGFIERVFADDT